MIEERSDVDVREENQVEKAVATSKPEATADSALVPGGPGQPLKLKIDPEFAGLVFREMWTCLPGVPAPDPNDKTVVERTRIRRERREQLKTEIQNGKIKNLRFTAGRFGDELVLVDIHHDLYQAVEELGIPFEIEEHLFISHDAARTHLLTSLLQQPPATLAQRVVAGFLLLPEYERRAKENQGRRTDLLSESEKGYRRVNVNKELAALIGIGTNKFCHLKQVWENLQKPEKERVFKQQRGWDLFDAFLNADISANALWRNFRDARKKRKDRVECGRQLVKNNQLPSSVNLSAKNGQGLPDEEEVTYTNPDLKQGYENIIYCGDNLETLRQLPDNIAGLILTSPDYNVKSVHYHIPIPQRPHAEYLEYLKRLIIECYRILRVGGRLAINIASTTNKYEADKARAYNTSISADLKKIAEEVGFLYRTEIIWSKRYAFKDYIPKGTIDSARNPFIAVFHEYILILCKETWTLEPPFPGAPSDLTADETREWCGSVWDIVPQSTHPGDHPCPFPETLAERVIKIYSYVGDLVVDVCNGSGTSTAVAARLGRKWVGMDISPKYCAHAYTRTQEAYAEFLDSLTCSTSEPDDTSAEDESPGIAPDTAA